MPSTAPSRTPTLAIVGGGISGLLLAITLHNHTIPTTIYESAASFREIGAGVGFQPNFVRTMALIDPRIRTAFLRCSNPETDPPKWFDVRIGDASVVDGDEADDARVQREDGKQVALGEVLFTIPARAGPRGGVHRAHFLDELVKLVPLEMARFGKRVVDVVEADDGSGDAVLHFADGTSARHTAVVGCDGIKSRTRELVLGPEAARPVFSGKVAYRGVLAMERAKEIMGESEPMTPQMYCGKAGHVLTFPIANGSILNVVAFASRPSWPPSTAWVLPTTHTAMLSDFATWIPRVRTLVSNLRNPDIWALFNDVPAHTFVHSRPLICLLGDAAHASTPHQGAGAGMAVEDVYVLGELLAEVFAEGGCEREKLKTAFCAYEAVRRPRVLRLVETSREAGKLWDLQVEGDDWAAFERNACSRMAWVWDHDIREDLERARELMREWEKGVGEERG